MKQESAEEAFRARLRDARLGLGLYHLRTGEVLQKDVAKMMGMPEGTVNRYFRDTPPSLSVIIELARVLRVDPGWLAFGEASKAPVPEWARPPIADEGADDQRPNEERAKRNLGLAREARKPHKPTRRRSG